MASPSKKAASPRGKAKDNGAPQLTRKEVTQTRLYSEAARLFRERGYAGTTTRALASAVGVQSASLYYHFKTKEDLLFNLCRDGWETMIAAVEPIATSDGPGLDTLTRTIEAHLKTAIENRDIFITMVTDARSLSRERQRLVGAMRTRYWCLLEDVLERAQAEGAIRTDVPARDMILVLRNLLSWTLFWFHDEGPLSFEAVVGLTTRMFLEGAQARA